MREREIKMRERCRERETERDVHIHTQMIKPVNGSCDNHRMGGRRRLLYKIEKSGEYHTCIYFLLTLLDFICFLFVIISEKVKK